MKKKPKLRKPAPARLAVSSKLVQMWLDFTPAQRVRFAALAKTTKFSMRHLVSGRRRITVDFAVRIEHAATVMDVDLDRSDLSVTCHECPFAVACS